MKIYLTLTFAILLTVVPWTSVADTDATMEFAAAEWLFSEPLEPAACLAAGNVSSWGYPPCWQIDGSYCDPPGKMTMCQWMPGEPELCICQSNNTYACG